MPTVGASSLRLGSLLNLAGAAGASASTLLLVLATTRTVSPADAGRVFGVTSGFLIAAAVVRVGTPTGVVLFISRREGAGPADVRRVALMALRPIAWVALALAVVVLPFSGPIGRSLHLGQHAGLTVAMLAVCLPAAVVLDTLLAVSRGTHRMGPTVLVDRLGRPGLQLVLTVVVAAFSPSVLSLTAAWALPYLLAAVAAYVMTPELRTRQVPGHPMENAEIDRIERAEFARFVLPRGIATVIQVCFARLDIILVAALAGPAEAALYTAATRFVSLCQFVQQAIATAGEPALARALGGGRTREALEIYRTTTVWLVTLLWPVLLGVAALSPEWLSVFGRTYTGATTVVLVLVLAMLVATSVGMVETVLNMDGRSNVLVVNNALALTVMMGLDLLLVPHLGAVGAALGWGAAIAVKNLVALSQLAGSVGGSPVTRSWLLAVSLNAVLLGLVPTLASPAGDLARVWAVVLGALAMVAACAVLRTRLRLDQLLGRAAASVPTRSDG